MDVIYMMLAYLPVFSGAIGILSILVYVHQLVKTRRKCGLCLIIGCVGISICLLIVCALFLAGVLGLGPKTT